MLHVATFEADALDAVVDGVNAAGYGLTFGLHSRIDDRVQRVVDRVRAGNVYVNRNQIGAVVGSQPFGGEGESGTGPKAGGPHYVRRLTAGGAPSGGAPSGAVVGDARLASAVAAAARGFAARGHRRAGGSPVRDPGEVRDLPFAPLELPGPTGESNRLVFAPRGVVLCLGPGAAAVRAQIAAARAAGNAVVAVADAARATLADEAFDPRVFILDGQVARGALATLDGIAAVACRRGPRSACHNPRRAGPALAAPSCP